MNPACISYKQNLLLPHVEMEGKLLALMFLLQMNALVSGQLFNV